MKITPAPCIVERSNITIREAFEIMRDSKTSYLLLVDSTGHLSGIITDRDLLAKFPSIVTDESLAKPVHTVMSRPVRTLPLELIHTAPEFMTTNDIRHVPVVDINPKTRNEEVMGILTERQVFKNIVRNRGLPTIYGGKEIAHTRKVIGVISPDGTLFQMMQKMFDTSMYIDLQRLRFTELSEAVKIDRVAQDCDAIVIDIDDSPSRLWSVVLKHFIENPDLGTVCVTYTRGTLKELKPVIETLNSKGVIRVYEKPLDIAAMTMDLDKVWAEEGY